VGTSGRWDEVVGTREDLEWGGVACEPGSADGAVGAARGAHARDVDEAGVGLDHPGQPRLDPGQHVDHAGEGHEVAGAGHATAGGGGGVGVPAGNRIHAARGDLVLRANRRGNSQEKGHRQEDETPAGGGSVVVHRSESFHVPGRSGVTVASPPLQRGGEPGRAS